MESRKQSLTQKDLPRYKISIGIRKYIIPVEIMLILQVYGDNDSSNMFIAFVHVERRECIYNDKIEYEWLEIASKS